jgi:hypothetical protein
MRKILIILFIIVSLSYCTKPVKIEIPDNPLIVVHAYLIANDTLRVRVSRSFSSISTEIYTFYKNQSDHGPLDTNKIFLRNADVKLYKDGVFAEKLRYTKNGFFIAEDFPESGHEYEIRIKADQMEGVRAKTQVPAIAEMENIEFSYINTQNNTHYYKGEVTYHCPQGSDMLIFSLFESLVFIDDNGEEQSYESNLNVGDHLEGGNITSSEDLYGGFYITVNSTEEHTESTNFFLSRYGSEQNNIDTVNLVAVLNSVSKEYIHFKTSLSKYYENGTNFGNPFNTPIQIYSNIEGGIGIFTGISADTLREQIIFDHSQKN